MKIRTWLCWSVCLLFVAGLAGCGLHRSQKDTKEAESIRNLGEAYLTEGDYTHALRELLKAEKMNPDDPFIQDDLGLAYMGKGSPEMAVSHFKNAIDLKPDYSPARNNLGTAYIALQEWDKAIECFKKVNTDLLYATPYYPLTNLGYVYYMKKDYAAAEKYYKQALEQKADFPEALHGLGQVYIATGRYDKAVKILKQAIKKVPKAFPYYMSLGKALTLNSDYNEAVNTYKKAAALVPDTPQASEAEEAAARVKNMW